MGKPKPKFCELLRDYRTRRGLSLSDLAQKSEIDLGNLSRIESGRRKPPELPLLLRLVRALDIVQDSLEWHELFKAAARDRFKPIEVGGLTYLGFESPLHGLPPEPAPTVSLTEAAFEIGKLAESRGVRRISVLTGDGYECFFYIGEKEAPQKKQKEELATPS
jgi:transcriptional regulator with XRE-family HTH domain